MNKISVSSDLAKHLSTGTRIGCTLDTLISKSFEHLQLQTVAQWDDLGI